MDNDFDLYKKILKYRKVVLSEESIRAARQLERIMSYGGPEPDGGTERKVLEALISQNKFNMRHLNGILEEYREKKVPDYQI